MLTALASWPIVRFGFRTRWEGVDRVPVDGGFVLAANHTSNFDAWPLALGLFPARYIRCMAKAELFRPPLGPLLTALGGFPIRREAPDRDAMVTAVELCRQGHVVVMFPEGTRRAKGLHKTRVAEPHTGAARIALRAGVPLVPAAITGTDRLARLGPIRVEYGSPVGVEDLASLDRRQAARVATERLMADIGRLETRLRHETGAASA